MKKRSYRAQKVNEVGWEGMADQVKDKVVVWAIDVAKVEQYGVLMNREREVVDGEAVYEAHRSRTMRLLTSAHPTRCPSSSLRIQGTWYMVAKDSTV